MLPVIKLLCDSASCGKARGVGELSTRATSMSSVRGTRFPRSLNGSLISRTTLVWVELKLLATCAQQRGRSKQRREQPAWDSDSWSSEVRVLYTAPGAGSYWFAGQKECQRMTMSTGNSTQNNPNFLVYPFTVGRLKGTTAPRIFDSHP